MAGKPAQNSGLKKINLDVNKIILVASGKGGVGKSTIATNISLALAKEGYRVGLLDADIYGPSVTKMFGTEKSDVFSTIDNKIQPVEKYNIKTISVANLIDPGKATIWRGPLIHSLMVQLLSDVNWGELDYLILDMPPGTGDIQISIANLIDVYAAVIVSTPQDVSLIDVHKCIDMFEKVGIRIAGIIENMSYFKCPNCSEKHYLFGNGGVKKYASEKNLKLLGEIPIKQNIMESAEAGKPYAIEDEEQIFSSIIIHL